MALVFPDLFNYSEYICINRIAMNAKYRSDIILYKRGEQDFKRLCMMWNIMWVCQVLYCIEYWHGKRS